MSQPTVEQIIHALGLQPLPQEGGLYRQTYYSADAIPITALPERYSLRPNMSSGENTGQTTRPAGTAIFYLLTDLPDSFSAFHRLLTDEIYHFYLGDPLEMTLLLPDGSSQQVILGQDVLSGQKVQYTVPHGVWQASRLLPGGRYGLVGTSMAPGYSWEDYEHGDRAVLLSQYSQERERILALTR